jgi:hypothetical protein
MTDPTPTDWRALCAELVDDLQWCKLELWVAFGEVEPTEESHALIDRARAALAQPEPKMIYRYSPVTIAECGGPCEQGPQYCDCGQIKGEPQPEPQGPTGRPAIEPVPQQEAE